MTTLDLFGHSHDTDLGVDSSALVPFDDLDLASLWQAYAPYGREAFLAYLRTLTSEPEAVDEIGFCADCNEPDHEDNLYATNWNHGSVCESCEERYYLCNDCNEQFPYITTTLNDTEVCEGCRNDNWSYCEDCDGYYRDENADEHAHNEDDGCGCESPAQSFVIRNNGEPPLPNDTRVTVTLPAGVISAEGIGQIGRFLRDQARSDIYSANEIDHETGETHGETRSLRVLSHSLDALGDQWQTRQGNYTKRLSRYAYNTLGLKLKPETISQVGCIAREHATAVDFAVEVTRDLNQPASDFAHSDSCWWQSYSYSRCTLKTNGGFGLRSFNAYGVSGRAWVMPLRQEDDKLIPTFETLAPSAFIVFNGYGDLQGYAAARIMSHLAGMTYRKVQFTVNAIYTDGGECVSAMYINGESAYLIAPEDIASRYTDGSLRLTVEQHSDLYDDERELVNA